MKTSNDAGPAVRRRNAGLVLDVAEVAIAGRKRTSGPLVIERDGSGRNPLANRYQSVKGADPVFTSHGRATTM